MGNTRTENTKKNIIWSYSDYFLNICFQFFSRTVIVNAFSSDYLGLSSLFSSILQVLNMAEMGFASAVIYNMYKPIAKNEISKVCCFLSYYKKIYRYIGISIICVGMALIPFLPKLIKGGWPSDINIYILYVLYLINTGISYLLFAYKSSLLTALQRVDLIKKIYLSVNILQYTSQLFIIAVFRDYYLFVTALVVGTAVKNIMTAIITGKYYPEYVTKGELDKESKKDILNKVKGLLIGNISNVSYNTFDSIIISAFLGLSSVAIYNNYLTVYNGIASIVGLLRGAMQSSVGNSVAVESIEKNYMDIQKWQFIFSIIALMCSTCMLCLYQPFMVFWMGKEMLLPMIDVVLLSCLLFIATVQHAFYLYLSAAGLWLEVKWAYILSTICNLILNILLGKLFKTTGIIIATLIATIVFGSIWQCIVVFKYYFKINVKEYLFKQIIYFAFTVFIWLLSFLLCNIITGYSIVTMLLRIVICIFISVCATIIVFRRTRVYGQCKELAIKVLRL